MLPFMNVAVAKSMDSSFRWKDGGWARGHCTLKPARGELVEPSINWSFDKLRMSGHGWLTEYGTLNHWDFGHSIFLF
jgi:hypothetical protein